MSAQVAADLRAAADVLERDGWTQGQFHKIVDGRWCHCAIGATEVSTGWWTDGGYRETYGDGPSRSGRMWRALAKHLGLLDVDPVYVDHVYDWNDDPDRTAAEVIAALRAAADAAEAQS